MRHPIPSRRQVLALPLAGAACLAGLGRGAAEAAERSDLEQVFQQHGATGTFVMLDLGSGEMTTVGGARASRRYAPASTFKIANSIIALDTGVVRDENEVIPYGGGKQSFPQWEKDMPLREALALSSVPIYQELARRIGLARYHDWLIRLDYGNRETGDVVDRFWLDGPLAISAIEQARFVGKLAQQSLDASSRAQAITRSMLRVESNADYELFGKTGWLFSATPNVGWWTGWVERGSRFFAFALNIDMSGEADLPKRLAIGRALLAKLGAI